jgi:hypothetical protein
MKRAEIIDLFEKMVRCHTLLEGCGGGHIPQSQASEQVFYAKRMADDSVCLLRRELKK